MKKLLSILGLSLLFPLPAQAATTVLNDNASFQVAAVYKLGLADEDMSSSPGKTGLGNSGKEITETDPCSKATCSGKTPVCDSSSGTAVCKCTSNSCGQGATCGSNGKCQNCASGTACNCPSGQVATGNGSCETKNYCSPNPCSGTTPVCKSDQRLMNKFGRGYACGCTSSSNSCGAGRKCSTPCDALNQTCVTNPASATILVYNCAACSDGDTTCGCPSGQVANGIGGCRAACSKGDTNCSLCSAGQVYDGSKCRKPCDGVTCPTGYSCLNGTGKGCCVKDPVICSTNCLTCTTSTSCTKCNIGYYLVNGKCTSCPANATCDGTVTFRCPSGYYRNGTTCAICPLNATCTNGTSFICKVGYEKSGDLCKKTINCSTCEAGYTRDLKTCPAGQVLQYGRICAESAFTCGKCVTSSGSSSRGGGGGGGSGSYLQQDNRLINDMI